MNERCMLYKNCFFGTDLLILPMKERRCLYFKNVPYGFCIKLIQQIIHHLFLPCLCAKVMWRSIVKTLCRPLKFNPNPAAFVLIRTLIWLPTDSISMRMFSVMCSAVLLWNICTKEASHFLLNMV